MPRRLPTALLALVLASFSSGLLAQYSGAWQVDTQWAELPGGADWDGSTSWITTDGAGLVYVLVRTAPYVRIFDRDGNFVRAWGGDPEIGNAHSITVDDQRNAWISDAANHVILKFSPEGELLMTLGTSGEAGDNASRDRFNQPNHVAIADNGDIYVSDGYVNARVVHFAPDGRFIRVIGGVQGDGPGELDVVHGVALDSRGRILVNDSDNRRVSVFDREGRFVESWAYLSRGGIEVTADDTVYISDVNEGVVNIVRDGETLATIPASRAHGLAVDRGGRDIYTSGASRRTVFKISPIQE